MKLMMPLPLRSLCEGWIQPGEGGGGGLLPNLIVSGPGLFIDVIQGTCSVAQRAGLGDLV